MCKLQASQLASGINRGLSPQTSSLLAPAVLAHSPFAVPWQAPSISIELMLNSNLEQSNHDSVLIRCHIISQSIKKLS